MPIDFTKLEAAGNGYIAVDGRGQRGRDWSELAKRICRHHFGVGSDGLLVVLPSDHAPVRMRVVNSDGSEAEMSGNGIRLFAKFVLDRGLARCRDGSLEVETGAGLRRVLPVLDGGRMTAGTVAMDVPQVRSRSMQLELGGDAVGTAWQHLAVTTLSLGNPHAVHLTEVPVDDVPLSMLGPLVERHPAFPDRTNFEVVNVLGRDRLRARIFERGEGETLSSGTGSTASAVAARVHGHTGDAVEVSVRGGRLDVRWDGEGPAYLSGPVREVFSGVFEDDA